MAVGKNKNMHYDLIIVGGGLVGRSLACALRAAPLKIALIDAAPQERPDSRLIALNYGSCSFLDKIGLWPAIEPFSAAIQAVHVSHRGRFGTTRMTAKQIQLPALGYVIPAEQINRALGKTLAGLTTENFSELRPATVNDIQLDNKQAELRLALENTEQHITGTLIIAADGSHSTLRQLLNFKTKIADYHQSALVTTTVLGHSHQHIAYERFLDDGALAMLPLQSTAATAATIWTASTTKITALMQLSAADFLQALQEQFGYRLGRLQGISTRHVYPLHFLHVDHPLQKNVRLIGNAAHTLHPVGAQGLNLALYEIAQLTQNLLGALEKKQPLQEAFAQPVMGHSQKTNLLLSHYLNPLFSSDFWGLQLARQMGMLGLDLCTPLKKQFSRVLAMDSMKWMHS